MFSEGKVLLLLVLPGSPRFSSTNEPTLNPMSSEQFIVSGLVAESSRKAHKDQSFVMQSAGKAVVALQL